MSTMHSALTEAQLHQAFHYEQDADPGAVGAGKYWLDTNTDPHTLKRRNGTDTGWVDVGASGSSPTFSGAQVIGNGTQSLTNNTDTAIDFDGTEDYDTDAYHDAGTPTRLTVPSTGYYAFGGSLEFAANTTGYRDIKIRVNGTSVKFRTKAPAAQSGGHPMTISGQLALTAGDYIEFVAAQTSGGALNVGAAGDATNNHARFWIQKVG